MKSRRRRVALALALASVALGTAGAPRPASAQSAEAAGTWEKIRHEDGIAVYRKDVPNSSVVAFRGVGVVDAPILRVASVLADGARQPEWMDSVAEVRELERSGPAEGVVYTLVKTPFPLTNRDFVTRIKASIDKPQKKYVLRMQATTHPKAPETSAVRGQILNSSFELVSIEGGQKTKIVAEIHADPRGAVPKWVVNMFQKDWPHNTISGLRKQVKKPDVRDSPSLAKFFADAGL